MDERGCVWNQGGTTEATLINSVNLGKVKRCLTSGGKRLPLEEAARCSFGRLAGVARMHFQISNPERHQSSLSEITRRAAGRAFAEYQPKRRHQQQIMRDQ